MPGRSIVRFSSWVLTWGLVSSLPAATFAEPEASLPLRDGYYLSLGVGGGQGISQDGTVGSLGQGLELTPRIRLGQLLSPTWGLGLLLHGGLLAREGWSGGGGGLSLEGLWTPSVVDVRAGIGLWGYALSRDDAERGREDDPAGALSARLHVTLSYTLLISPPRRDGKAWGVGMYFDGSLSPGDLVSGAAVVGIELTRWFGRPEAAAPSVERLGP